MLLIINLLFFVVALLLAVGEFSMGLLGSFVPSVLAIIAAALMLVLVNTSARSRLVVWLALLANTALVLWLGYWLLTAISGGNLVALLALAGSMAIPVANGVYALKALAKTASASATSL